MGPIICLTSSNTSGAATECLKKYLSVVPAIVARRVEKCDVPAPSESPETTKILLLLRIPEFPQIF